METESSPPRHDASAGQGRLAGVRAAVGDRPVAAGRRNGWTFLTNHARVLSTVAQNPGIRMRDIAAQCRITERAVQAIVADLEAGGYLTHRREGRRNIYRVLADRELRHPADRGKRVADILALPPDAGASTGTA